MCLTIPKKVIEVGDNIVIVENLDGSRQELKSIVELRAGDYVLSQQNIIVQRLDKEEVQDLLDILKGGVV